MKENGNDYRVLFNESYEESINYRKSCLEGLIIKLKKEIDKAPEGSLRIIDKKTYTQYFWRTDSKDTNGKYIPNEKVKVAKALAQKEYNKQVLKLALKEEKIISKYSKLLSLESYQKIYDDLHKARKRLVEPIQLDLIDYIDKWKSEEYDPMPFIENTEFYTNNGIRVRSKSELIIANLLEQYEIPYKYEKPLQLQGLGTVRPDFICLNNRERKEYVREHFGMMDNSDYVNKNISKLNIYQQNGYHLGENMIASFETSQQPLSSKNIKNLIEQHLE